MQAEMYFLISHSCENSDTEYASTTTYFPQNMQTYWCTHQKPAPVSNLIKKFELTNVRKMTCYTADVTATPVLLVEDKCTEPLM